MGVSVSDLPISKAAQAAESLMKSNPPPVEHKAPETKDKKDSVAIQKDV